VEFEQIAIVLRYMI